MTGRILPDEGFRRDRATTTSVDSIRAYWTFDGEECEYMASRLLHPWHKDIVWKRLRYFFYWRRSLYEGVCLDTDAGYIWLHMIELLVVDDDPIENHECLLRMRDAYRGQNESVDAMLDQACCYFEAMHGLEIRDTESLDRSYRMVRMCRALSSDRFVPLSARDVRLITGFKGKTIDRYAEPAAVVVSAALHEIGRMYVGRGILELCSRPMDVLIEMPFRDAMFDRLIAPLNLRCRDLKRSEPFVELVKNLQKTCILRLAGRDENLPANLRKYQGTLEKCIDAWKEGRLDEITTPYAKLESPIAVMNHLAVTYEEMILNNTKDGTWPSYRFRTRMRDYGGIYMPFAPASVRMDSPRPCYSKMTLDEFAYYQSWKESVLKGERPEVSVGAMWLLVNEIIHDDTLDPESALEALRACRKASMGQVRVRVESVMADWCLLKGIDADMSELFCDSIRLGAFLVRALTSDPPGRLNDGMLKRLDQSVGDADMDLVNASIAMLYRYHNNTLAEMFNASLSTSNVRIFEECACMPISMQMDTFSDLGSVTKFLVNVGTIVCSIQNGEESPRCPFGFGTRNRDIVREVSLKTMEKKRVARIRSMSEDVKLDMDAVNSAVEDLDAVTGLMYSGVDEETAPTIEEPVQEQTRHDDPWEELASRLDRELLGYLHGSLKGTRADRRKEKAVNEAAMDTVGDIVVEDGQAVEDYSEQIERITKNYLENE